ncbi:MAG: hypothetical protein IPG25_18340 [Proteobacteria bacterium]|nr:hypothetical protein [Pseudomonadota bacterium]
MRRSLSPALQDLTAELTSRRRIGTVATLFARHPAGAGLMGLVALSALRGRRYPWQQVVRWFVTGAQLWRMIRGRRQL